VRLPCKESSVLHESLSVVVLLEHEPELVSRSGLAREVEVPYEQVGKALNEIGALTEPAHGL
jgi:hypothetical protein